MKYVKLSVLSICFLSLFIFLLGKVGFSIEKIISDIELFPFGLAGYLTQKIYGLRRLVLIISLLVSLIIFSIIFIHTLNHQKSLRYKKTTFREGIGVEIYWSMLPVLIVFSMIFYIAKTSLVMSNGINNDITSETTDIARKSRQ